MSLSRSVIWQLQGWFYEAAGLSAWGESGPVPFEITSNAFIARYYASIALPLLPEVLWPRGDERRTNKSDPLFVLELGAGHVSAMSWKGRVECK